MKLGNIIKGSVDYTPFAPRSAHMDPVSLGLGIGSLALGGIGNLLGFGSNKKTNETNLQIARETNAQNYQMFKEQNAFNLDMWNKQNEYNLPSNVVQRLKQAGINPAAMYGQVTPASQLQSAQPHAMVAPQMEAWKPDTSSVLGAVDAFNQSRLAASQIKNINAQTDRTVQDTNFERSLNPHRLKFLQEQAKREGYIGDLARTQLAYEQAVNGMKISQVYQDFRLSQKQYDKMVQDIQIGELQKGLYQVQLSYAPKLSEAELQKYYATCAELRASVGLINANRLLTDEQRLHEVEKRTSTIIENGLKGFDFKIKEAVKDYVIDQQISESDKAYYEAGNAAKFFYGGEPGRRLPLEGFTDSSRYNGRVLYRHRPMQR